MKLRMNGGSSHPGEAGWVQSRGWSRRFGLKLMGLRPLAAIIALVLIFQAYGIGSTFGSPMVLLILNTLFLGVIFLAGAIVCARGFLATGSWQIMLMGCGLLTIGVAGPLAGWLAIISSCKVKSNKSLCAA